MAPIKFEENIKDKLENRNLSPSPEAWSKLSNRLDAEDKKSKSPLFWWLSIAAGLIILVTVSTQFLGSDESESVMPDLVEEPKEKLKITPKEAIEDVESIQLVNQEAIEKDENINTNKAEQIKETQIIDYKKVTRKTSTNKTQVAERKRTNSLNKETENEMNTAAQLTLNKEKDLKEAVASTLNTLKSENTSVTDREIDSLLKVASKELFKDKLQKETSKTVDANALLLSVEEDMGQSFRSKVFEALKESYETVKTRVVERNN